MKTINNTNPLGLCMCGCGQITTRWIQSIYKLGIKKGDYRKFVKGHHRPLDKEAFSKKMSVIMKKFARRGKDHPSYNGGFIIRNPPGKKSRWMVRTSDDKVIFFSHIVMQDMIGRELKKGEVVHHINFDSLDDSKTNLQLMSHREHVRLHRRIDLMQGKKFGRYLYK